MTVSENPNKFVASISLEVYVNREFNLGFYRPKKDQCITYKNRDVSTQENLEELFDKHTQDKVKVRALKNICKSKAEEDPNCETAIYSK